jgi:hypothetical protein
MTLTAMFRGPIVVGNRVTPIPPHRSVRARWGVLTLTQYIDIEDENEDAQKDGIEFSKREKMRRNPFRRRNRRSTSFRRRYISQASS